MDAIRDFRVFLIAQKAANRVCVREFGLTRIDIFFLVGLSLVCDYRSGFCRPTDLVPLRGGYSDNSVYPCLHSLEKAGFVSCVKAGVKFRKGAHGLWALTMKGRRLIERYNEVLRENSKVLLSGITA